jgi:hypothetical protein
MCEPYLLLSEKTLFVLGIKGSQGFFKEAPVSPNPLKASLKLARPAEYIRSNLQSNRNFGYITGDTIRQAPDFGWPQRRLRSKPRILWSLKRGRKLDFGFIGRLSENYY